MGKKATYTSEMVISTSFELFKEYGIEYISARNVAKHLKSSPVPIYSTVGSMEKLKTELIIRAKDLFMEYINKNRTGLKFVDIGMGIVIFAREESKLFSNVFLKELSSTEIFDEFVNLIFREMHNDMRFAKLTNQDKKEIFMDCWTYVHGLATLVATKYINHPNDNFIKDSIMNNAAKRLYDFLEMKNNKF